MSKNLTDAVQAKFPDTVPRETFRPELVSAFGKMKTTVSNAAAASISKKSSSSKSSSENSEDARNELEMINENSGYSAFAYIARTRMSLATEVDPWTVNGCKTKRRRRRKTRKK